MGNSMAASISRNKEVFWEAVASQINVPIPSTKDKESYLQWFQDHKTEVEGIEELQIYNKKLVKVPSLIRELKSLKKLDLERNELQTLSLSVTELPHLETLILHSNCFASLPSSLTGLAGLKILDLTLNPLATFPEVICDLPKLEKLKLHNCRLRSISPKIGDLNNLKALDIAHNKLRELPDSISNLANLVKINIEGNSLRSVPKGMWNNPKINRQLRDIWWKNSCSVLFRVSVLGVGVLLSYQSIPPHVQFQIEQIVLSSIVNYSFF
jgi:Leucine-rich repeat (LRR) protein